MNEQIKSRLKRTALLSLLALMAGAGIGYMQILSRETSHESSSVAGADIGGPFTLVDQDGRAVTEKIFEGSYALIYFGFTYCPAICPTELQKISKTLAMLEQSAPQNAAKILPVFVTVDPERDTPAALKSYVRQFHPRLIGLTGTPDQIEDIKKKYRIYASKVDNENSTEYTVDHSSFIYLMSPKNELLGIYRVSDDARTIASAIEKFVH